jgi:hypothetical protein
MSGRDQCRWCPALPRFSCRRTKIPVLHPSCRPHRARRSWGTCDCSNLYPRTSRHPSRIASRLRAVHERRNGHYRKFNYPTLGNVARIILRGPSEEVTERKRSRNQQPTCCSRGSKRHAISLVTKFVSWALPHRPLRSYAANIASKFCYKQPTRLF